MRCGRWRARTLRLGYGPQRLGYGLTWCGRARARAAMRVRRPRAAALEPAQPIRVGRRQEPASGGHRPAAAVEVLSSPSAAACAARAHLEPALRVRVGRRHRQHVGEGRPADGAHAPPAAAWCVCVCVCARARVRTCVSVHVCPSPPPPTIPTPHAHRGRRSRPSPPDPIRRPAAKLSLRPAGRAKAHPCESTRLCARMRVRARYFAPPRPRGDSGRGRTRIRGRSAARVRGGRSGAAAAPCNGRCGDRRLG